jgi:hypothetical protein
MKSSYAKRSISTRTTYADGTTVTAGPPVNATYPLGLFREDYEYIPTSASTPDFLDAHNGRFCVTPEYPAGIYCYFATVDQNWNSSYPYVVGPTFYGTKTAAKVTSITESVTQYVDPAAIVLQVDQSPLQIIVFPNPASDLIAIQTNDLVKENIDLNLYDWQGRLVSTETIYQGSTIAYIDTKTLYSGMYLLKATIGNAIVTKEISIAK